MALALQDNQFSIVSSDATLGTITTDMKPSKLARIKLNTSIRSDSATVVILQGTMHVMDLSGPIHYVGRPNSATMRAWDQMAEVAAALKGELRYR